MEVTLELGFAIEMVMGGIALFYVTLGSWYLIKGEGDFFVTLLIGTLAIQAAATTWLLAFFS